MAEQGGIREGKSYGEYTGNTEERDKGKETHSKTRH